MKTVTYKSVFDSIVRLHGIDPLTQVPQNMARSIVDHSNARIRTAWEFWDWPELTITEERAYRMIWNSTHQFKHLGHTNQPDEFFYIGSGTTDNLGSMTYYRVKANVPDPPVGTLPTNTTYFEILDPVDRYIDYKQTCRHPMGTVLGIYKTDPRFKPYEAPNLLSYRPGEKGIDVLSAAGPTVFVHFRLPEPNFTMVPLIPDKPYNPGEIGFYSQDCYRALTSGAMSPPTNENNWSLEPMPAIFRDYVKWGAFADCLKETNPAETDPAAWQVRAARIQKAEQDADDALIDNCKVLLIQGQKFFYGTRYRYYGSYGYPYLCNGGTL